MSRKERVPSSNLSEGLHKNAMTVQCAEALCKRALQLRSRGTLQACAAATQQRHFASLRCSCAAEALLHSYSVPQVACIYEGWRHVALMLLL